MQRTIAACLLLALFWLLNLASATAQPSAGRTLLFGAWTPDEVGLLGPSGVTPATRKTFDLRLLDAIGDRAEFGFVLLAREGQHIDAALTRGEIDFALPEIVGSPEPAGTILSLPYRQRTDLLFLSPNAPAIRETGIASLRAALELGLRIGVNRDIRHGPAVTALLTDPRFAGQIVQTPRAVDNLDRVLAGTLDGFLAVRLAGLEAIAARPAKGQEIRVLPTPIEIHDVHIRFSAARVDPATIDQINRTILALRADGVEAHIREQATTPILLRLAAATRWFNALDVLGTIAFALSGVLIARREQYSLVGAFILAALPAVGGGVVRDLLVGRSPIGIMASPMPLLLVAGTVAACFVLFRLFGGATDRLRHWDRSRAAGQRLLSIRNLYEVTDALGLAAFTVIGVAVAVRYWAEPLWLWGPLCAALSGAGGGILRDVLRASGNIPALRTSIYAEVCIVWGLALSLTVDFLAREERPELLRLAVVLTVAGAFLTRMAAVWFGAKSPRF